MARRRVEEEIGQLNHLRERPPAEAVPALRRALADRVNLMVAKGAALAAEMRLADLLPDLLRAFDRLLERPVERDPQCWGKNAIVKGLVALEYRGAAPFLRGMRHVQMEPVWGGEEDTAATLRGACALALPACADITRADVFRRLVDALADKALPVRLDAARAMAQMAGDEASLLLRLKAHLGDRESQVIGQVFDLLLGLEPHQGTSFVAEFLHAPGSKAEEAALALGSSRLPGAVQPLQDAWTQARDRELRAVLLRAISATRQPAALEFLLNLVRAGRAADAVAALDALAIHRDSADIRRQANDAVAQREPEIRGHIRQSFTGVENA